MTRRAVIAAIVVGSFAPSTSGQSPSDPVHPSSQATPKAASADLPPPLPLPISPEELARKAEAKRSIARPNSLPRRDPVSSPKGSAADDRRDPLDERGRYANPGGVGRYAEYYTANTPTSQYERQPRPAARIGNGGVPDRASQIAAFQAGQMRTRNIQNNINTYGRPYAAYGFGLGYGIGLGAGGLYGGGFR